MSESFFGGRYRFHATPSGSGRYARMELSSPMGLNVLTGQIVDAALMVHRAIGPGFVEAVYEEAMSVELAERDIPFLRQPAFDITYLEHRVGTHRLDFLVDGRVVVELKAVAELAPVHTAQILSYVRVSRATVGLLINFNVRLLRDGIRRVMAAIN